LTAFLPLCGSRLLAVKYAKTITAVDAHARGEPGRVIIVGVADVPGKTMFGPGATF